MNNTPTIYRADGTQKPVAPKNKKHFSLKELKAIIGGHPGIIFLNDSQIMVVNVDGKPEGLPLNVRATEIIRKHGSTDTIVGDALVAPSQFIK
jgi:hypothetical protein